MTKVQRPQNCFWKDKKRLIIVWREE
jgi:hypothetical protein